MPIDYARMKKLYPQQKAALTRALKTGDHAKVRAVCAKAVREWNEVGAWPDGWSRWQRALDDSAGWNGPHVLLEDL
jgi:hypothetical protein